jgi:hypothetical protein
MLGADAGLEGLVGGALLVVELHVVEALEDGLADDGVALAARVAVQLVGLAADEVRFSVLRLRVRVNSIQRYEGVKGGMNLGADGGARGRGGKGGRAG